MRIQQSAFWARVSLNASSVRRQSQATMLPKNKWDRVSFQGQTIKGPKSPELPVVQGLLADFRDRITANLQANHLKTNGYILCDEPITTAAATYHNHQSALPSAKGHSFSYLLLGFTPAGETVPTGLFTIRQDAPGSPWRNAGLRSVPATDPVYIRLMQLMDKYPHADIQLASGLPGTGTSAVEAAIIKTRFLPRRVHILRTTNSHRPGTYPEKRYPFKPGDTMFFSTFMAGLKKAGRLHEERTLLRVVWSALYQQDPIDARNLQTMLGAKKATAFLKQAIAVTKGLDVSQQESRLKAEAQLKRLIQTTAAKTKLNMNITDRTAIQETKHEEPLSPEFLAALATRHRPSS